MFWWLQGKIHSFPLPAPRGCWHFFTCSHITLVSASVITLHFSFLSTTASLMWWPCDCTRATWIIQDNLPFSRSLTWEHLQSPFFQIRQNLQILGIRTWTSLGVYPTTFFLPPFLFFLTIFFLCFIFKAKYFPKKHLLKSLFLP